SNQFDDTNTTPLPEINFKSVSGGFKEIIGDFEKQVLLKVLEKNKWRRDKAAKELQLTKKTLYRKMSLYGIK
ncbi:MAG: hypothetical protein KAR45_18675, partial [Desulfobacteraceae bacterium]|nr:hypothetical protein [Desulfobacteraceae bacterium]